ncbi:MAG: hypothetical protein KDD15_34340, partial [Lewinella sp.]|nr:hypothetical protein [Lewinella sp.]
MKRTLHQVIKGTYRPLQPALMGLLLLLAMELCAQAPQPSGGQVRFSLDQLMSRSQLLSGEWEMARDTLLGPEAFQNDSLPFPLETVNFPELWNKQAPFKGKRAAMGVATYHLHISLDRTSDTLLGLFIPDFYSAYEMWINGIPLAHNGKVGMDASSTIPHWLPMVQPFPVSDRELDIVLQIANFHHYKGGPGEPIRIGRYQNLKEYLDSRYFFLFIIMGLFLMTGFFLLSFWLVGHREKGLLFFSLFCLVYSYYS